MMSDQEQPQPPDDAAPQPVAPAPSAAEPPAYFPGNYAPEPAPADTPPRGRRRLLLIVAAALSAFVACAGVALIALVLLNPGLRSRLLFLNPVAAPPPEAPQKYAGPPAGAVAITDDFGGSGGRWDRSQTSVAGGAYELVLELDNFDSYGLFLGGDGIRDFDLSADATFVAGPPDAEFGIRFRQSAPDEHLIFSISPSGFYRLARVSDKSYTSLVPWTRDGRIRTGVGATNRLRVVAEGPAITGYINGEQVLTYSDEQPQAGQLTLGLVTFEQGGLTVRFDNLEGFAMAGADGAEPARIDLAQQFDDPAAAPWSVGGATVSGGAYELFVGGSVVSWQQPLPTGSSAVEGDFVLEVDATMLSGNGGGGGYGLMFGDGGAFDFYALLILPEGGLMLFRNGPDGGMIIPPVQVESVNPGLDATNRIRIEASGETLTITVNDEALPPLQFPDGIIFDGMAGVILQGADADGVRARFDNFHLEELE
jgi:hypothetical protein